MVIEILSVTNEFMFCVRTSYGHGLLKLLFFHETGKSHSNFDSPSQMAVVCLFIDRHLIVNCTN